MASFRYKQVLTPMIGSSCVIRLRLLGAGMSARRLSPKRSPPRPRPGPRSPCPPSVTVAHPVVREVTDYQDFTGHIEAAQTAEIRARASGNLDKVCFKPGMSVKKGDVLFEIDPRLYQAELDQAAGAVKQAQIRLDQRNKEFARFQELLKSSGRQPGRVSTRRKASATRRKRR